MTEFVQVMKQWGWLCSTHICEDCSDCVLAGTDVCEHFAKDNAQNAAEIEKRVMQWAKEQPEPQYPTWAELLYQDFLIWCQEKYPGRAKDEKAWFDYIYETPIPADMAEKLRLKPKEANENG